MDPNQRHENDDNTTANARQPSPKLASNHNSSTGLTDSEKWRVEVAKIKPSDWDDMVDWAEDEEPDPGL